MAPLFPRLVNFELTSLIIFTLLLFNNAEFLDTGGSEIKMEETLNQMMDSIILDLLTRYDSIKADEFWHPNEFVSGNEDRKETSTAFEQSMGLFGMFKEMSTRMNTWREVVSQAEDTLSKKMNVNGDNTITGKWKVKTISADDVSVEGRDARSEDVFNVLTFGKVLWTEDDFTSTSEHILDKMQEMDNNLIFLHNELNKGLQKNSLGRQIVSSQIIMNGNVFAESADIKNYIGDTFWNLNAEEFFKSLAHNGKDINIIGGIGFAEAATTKELRTQSINAVPVADFARLSADNRFQCSSSFESVESFQDIQAITVNSLNLAEAVVMADDIRGLKLTDGIVAYEGVQTSESLPFDNILLKSTPQAVTSPMMFEAVEIQSPASVGSVNNVDFQSFSEKIISKTFQGKITGTKTFSKEASLETLFMSSWNGLNFPQAFFMPSDRNIVLKGLKSFSKLNTDELVVNGNVDGINVADLVTRSNFEEIDSTWIFNGPTRIHNDLKVERTVDNIFMESLMHQGILESSSQSFSPNADTIIFKQPIHIEKFHVEEDINGKDAEGLFGDVFLFEGKKCSMPGRTTVMGDVVFKNINIKDSKINGFSIQRFLTKDTTQHITRPVILSGSVTFQELLAMGRFDNVKVSDVLEKATRISGATSQATASSTVPWDVHFESIACQEKLTVQGPVNGMANYKNSVARTRGVSSQTFLGSVILNNPAMKSLSTDKLTIDSDHTLQKLNVNKWNAARAKLSEPAFFSRPFIANRISTESNFDAVHVNGVAVKDLQENVFRTDRERQVFSGPIKITNGISVLNGNVNFLKTVDGFFIQDFIDHGLPVDAKNDKPIVLSNQWQFQALKMTQGVQMDGTNVCGVNLDQILLDSVKRTDQVFEVSGEKSFVQPLEIRRSLKSPQINGKVMAEVFHLNKDNQEIKELAVFTSDVTKEKLNVDSINNVQISWLSEMHSFEAGQHVLNHDVLINGLFKTNSLQVDGTAQNENLNKFLSNAFKHSDSNIRFHDQVTLEKPIIANKDVQVGSYDNIHLNELINGVTFLTEDHIVEKFVSFSGIVNSNDLLTVDGNVEAENLANGLDWGALRQNAIRINDNSVALDSNNFLFEHIVLSAPSTISSLNGIQFENFVTLNSPQDVGTLKIQNAFFDSSNVDVKGSMGGFKIQDEFRDTLMSNADSTQTISGTTTIQGPVQVKRNMQCFGSDFKDQVITTHENVLLKGPVEFSKRLVIRKNVKITQPIQGHSVESIFSDAFSMDKGEKQVISGQWEFRGPVTFVDNVSGKGLGDKANIQALVQEKEKELEEAHQILTEEKNRFKRNCASLEEIRNEMASNPVKLDSFDLHQVISAPMQAANVLPVATSEGENAYLMLQTSNCELHRFQWHPSTELFHRMIEPTTLIGKVQSWESITPADGESSIIVLAREPSECSTQPGLYVMTTSPNGDVSPLTTISGLSVKSFKLTKNPENTKVLLFAIFEKRSNELNVFEWSSEQEIFDHNTIIRFSSPMERVDVTTTSTGIGILCHNKGEVHMYQYSPSGNNRVLLEGTRSFQASTTAPLSVFQNFDSIFALVPESGSTPALIQPACNFQVMRFLNGGQVESVQKLHVPEVMSAAQWTFSKKNFIAFLSKSYGLSVYKFMGLNGFQTIASPSRVFDGFMLKAFSLKRTGFTMPQPFLLTLSTNRIEVFRANVFGDKFTSDFQDLCAS